MSRLDALPEREKRIVDAVRAVSRARSIVPYLVGGPVRDLELGREVIDLDISVEEGARELSTDLGRRLHGEVREFQQFLTFKVTFADGVVLDIATTRRETYPHPGALPVVAKASLKEDLQRRDFTINAIALNLLDEAIVDPFEGIADLRAGLIRILHDRSFIDDPTRIVRALRLATRLGFSLEERTRALLEAAVSQRALDTVSRDRKFRELSLAFREPNPTDVLAAFSEARLLHDLLGIEDLDRERLRSIERISEEADRDLLFLAALKPANLSDLGLSDRRAATLRELIERGETFGREIATAKSDEERFALLSAATPELRALASLDEEARHGVEAWKRYRDLDLRVRGDELGVPPGPHIAKALAKTRLALSRNEIAPSEARAFASRAALEYLDSSKTRHE